MSVDTRLSLGKNSLHHLINTKSACVYHRPALPHKPGDFRMKPFIHDLNAFINIDAGGAGARAVQVALVRCCLVRKKDNFMQIGCPSSVR